MGSLPGDINHRKSILFSGLYAVTCNIHGIIIKSNLEYDLLKSQK